MRRAIRGSADLACVVGRSPGFRSISGAIPSRASRPNAALHRDSDSGRSSEIGFDQAERLRAIVGAGIALSSELSFDDLLKGPSCPLTQLSTSAACGEPAS